MLKIFDKDHNAIGHIVKYKDCKIESEVATGDKTLSFTYLAKHHALTNEMYIQTKDDEYVIKEVPAVSGSFPKIVAILNLEDLQKDMWQSFSVTDTTIDAAVQTVLAGTGWTIGYCDVTKKRNAGMMQVSTLDVIQKLCTAFMCEPVFDTINKTVSFYTRRGEDKGMYFMSGLNLKKVQKKSTSYDYYTRIIPIGQDGLTIESVNDGKNYLENFQYSNKILTYIWKDESYTDPQALLEDAQLKLEDLSKPVVAYSVDVRDLAAQKEEYSILSYAEGDTVKLIDQETGTMVSQRIKKLVRYPDNPEKNTCEIANTFLTFEEMQQKYKEAADIINFTVTGEGRYTGTISVSDILKFEEGLAGSSTIGGINSSISTMEGDIALVKLTVGEITSNYVTTEQLAANYATIGQLEVMDAYVHSFDGKYATIEDLEAKTVTAEDIRAAVVDVGYLTANDADLKYASITLANVETANIGTLFARVGILTDVTVANGYITGELNGVRINADVINAGTLSVDRLLITGEDSIIYQINAQSSGLSSSVLTDEIYKNYINGSAIVAESITGDRIAATTITGNHIIAGSITGNEIAANTITGNEIATNTITANNIDVIDLFAQDIVANGSISGVTLHGVYGDIGGWNIDSNCLYSSYTVGEETTTVVMQNVIDNAKFSYAYITLDNCTATITGTSVLARPVETAEANINIRIPLKTGPYTLYIYSGYIAKYSDVEYPDIQWQWIDSNGDLNFEMIEVATEVDRVTGSDGSVRLVKWQIDNINVPVGSIDPKLLITHPMPSAKTGETYEFIFQLEQNGIVYDLSPKLSVAGVTVDKFLAVQKEVAGEVTYPFYVTGDGYLYAENALFTGNSAIELVYQSHCSILTSSGLTLMYDSNNNFVMPEKRLTISSSGITSGNGCGISLYETGIINVTGKLTVSGVDISGILKVAGDTTLRFPIGAGTATANPSVQLRKSGSAGSYALSLVYYNESGGTTYYNLINADGSRNFALASHTHSYLPLSGGTLTGALTSNSKITTTSQIDAYCMYVRSSGQPWINFYSKGATTYTSRIVEESDHMKIQYGNGGRGIRIAHPSTWHVSPTTNDGVYLGDGSYRWLGVYAKSTSISTSDEREKNIICSLVDDDRYAKLFMQLKPILYTWKDDEELKGVHIGLGAQTTEQSAYDCGITNYEIAAIVHDYFNEPRENDGAMDGYSMSYEEFLVLTIPFVQSHELTLTDHAAKLDNIEAQLESLKTELDEAHIEIARLKKLANIS